MNKKIIAIDNPDLILSAKENLEKTMNINKSNNIIDFINFLNMQKSIYVCNEVIIPFSIIENYLFYVPYSTTADYKFLNNMELINFDINTLQEISIQDIIKNNITTYFLIDSKYYK